MNRTRIGRYSGPGEVVDRGGLHPAIAGVVVLMLLLVPQAMGAINGKITYYSDLTGHNEVYVMNPDGSARTRLTSDDSAVSQSPAWSPDGQKIVFESNRDGFLEIYVMDPDGTNQTRLTSLSLSSGRPAWSPDGTRIAFYSDQGGNIRIVVMDADGSNQTLLTANTSYDWSPAWSPDSGKIVFASDRTGHFEIFSMNADGSNQTRLTSTGAGVINEKPCWSPDGTKIVFDSNRDGNYQIYVMNPDGSGQTRLTVNAGYDWSPAWSPDGKRIVFTSWRNGPGQIYIMNADGSGQTRVFSDTSLVSDEPEWYGPVVAGITPDSGKRGKTVRITNLTGTGFASGAKAALVKGKSVIKGKANTWVNLTKMTCTFRIPSTAQAGKWSVRVTNPYGVSGTRAKAFTVK